MEFLLLGFRVAWLGTEWLKVILGSRASKLISCLHAY